MRYIAAERGIHEIDMWSTPCADWEAPQLRLRAAELQKDSFATIDSDGCRAASCFAGNRTFEFKRDWFFRDDARISRQHDRSSDHDPCAPSYRSRRPDHHPFFEEVSSRPSPPQTACRSARAQQPKTQC